MEELRQKAADLTALQAIGPRKKPKLENADGPSQTSNGLSSSSSSSSSNILSSRPQVSCQGSSPLISGLPYFARHPVWNHLITQI